MMPDCAYPSHKSGSVFHEDGDLCPMAGVNESSSGGRGMMTAEQFYDEWIKKPDADAGNRRSFFRFAEAYAAAHLPELTAKLPETFFVGHDLEFRLERLVDGWQRAVAANLAVEAQLAEKERERDNFDSSDNEKRYQQWLKERTRAEAAEQRLQEAQAEIKRLHKLFCDLTPGGSEFAGDPDYCAKYLQQKLETQCELLKKKVIALRQREAELEQLREQKLIDRPERSTG